MAFLPDEHEKLSVSLHSLALADEEMLIQWKLKNNLMYVLTYVYLYVQCTGSESIEILISSTLQWRNHHYRYSIALNISDKSMQK